MYRSGHIITYLLVFLLIFIAVSIFIFRDDIFIEVEYYFIKEPMVQEIRVETDELFDPEIFKDDRLLKMEKTVPYFNFNHLGRTPPSGMEDSQLPIFADVFLGNNQPFR